MIELRPHQTAAIEQARKWVRAGKRAPLIVAPCSFGKTRTAAAIIASHVGKGGRAIFVATTHELVKQAAVALREVCTHVGIISAKLDDALDLTAPVQVASAQTLLSRGCDDFVPTLLVFDEAHLSAANEMSKLLSKWPGIIIIGLTATPATPAGRALGNFYDCIVSTISIRELTAQGYLAPLDIVAPSRPLEPGQLAMRPVDAWLKHGKKRQCIVFAPNVETAEAFDADFRALGVRSSVVHGSLSTEERTARLAAYASRELDVMVNVSVLTTGFDHPPTGMSILARRCLSLVLYIQSTGRILRIHESKKRALLIDLVGAVHIHGRPDADRKYDLDASGISSVAPLPPGSFCKVCGCIRGEERVCTECGFELPPFELPRVVDAPMKLLAKDWCSHDDDKTRLDRLRKWVIEGQARGHKPTAAIYKYRSVYGRAPTREELREVGAFKKLDEAS